MEARKTPLGLALAWTDSDTLNVNDVFPGERVAFPIGALSPTVREVFSWCFAATRAANDPQ